MSAESVAAILATVLAEYRAVEPRMREIDLAHPGLQTAAVGFAPPWYDGAALGVIVTPWAINAALLPLAGDPWAEMPVGTKTPLALPSGRYEFVLARMETGPSFRICSLFSPCFEFEDQAAALAVAEAALVELTTPAAAPAPPEPPSRRDLFRRVGAAGEET